MYGTILIYIVVLMSFAVYEPSPGPGRTQAAWTDFPALLAVFFVATLARFRLLDRALARGSIPSSSAAAAHDRLVFQHTMLAVGLALYMVFGLKARLLFGQWAPVRAVPTLGVFAFALWFSLFLLVVWALGYPSYRRASPSPATLPDYLASQLSLGLPVVLLWMAASGLADLLFLVPAGPFADWFSSPWGQASYSLAALAALTVFGPVLLTRMWRCRPLPRGPLRDRMEHFLNQHGFTRAGIVLWPLFGGRMITAAVMGLVGRFRYILVTDALLRLLAPEELESVLAHEMGHVKKKHLLYYLCFIAGYMVVSFVLLTLLPFPLLFLAVLFPGFAQAAGDPEVTTLLFSVVVLGSFIVYFRFLFGFFMRNFERQADVFALETMGTAAPLISCFVKISLATGRSPDEPSWHHFGISQRIGFLQQCARDPSLIARHHRRIKRGLWVFFSILGALGLIVAGFSASGAGETLAGRLAAKALTAQVETASDTAGAWFALGSLYHAQENWAEARKAYEQSLGLDPANAEAANALAWLLATATDAGQRDPRKALTWARHAAALDPAPHILDTLAEALYINGEYKQAMYWGEAALAGARDNRAHYRRQLEKFRQAL